jgi:hypothetical protein
MKQRTLSYQLHYANCRESVDGFTGTEFVAAVLGLLNIFY